MHLQIEPIEPTSPSGEDARAPAGEVDRVFEQLEAAYPKIGLGATFRDRARAALRTLVAEGVDVEALVKACRAYAADKSWKRKDLGLDHWLHDRRFRAWWPEAQLALDGPAPTAAAEDPRLSAVRDAVRPFLDDGKYRSFFEPATLRVRDGVAWFVCRTGMARDWVRDRCWGRVCNAWKATGAAEPIRLTTKAEFEAAMQPQGVE